MDAKTDRRIAKTQAAIQGAFLEMLLKDGFDAITVKDITEKANIGRKTFYLHYMDKFDLLNAIVIQHLNELETICEQKKEMDFITGTIIWFRYFETHKSFFAALFASESTVSFRHRLLVFIMEQLSRHLKEHHCKNTAVLQKFMGMAVLGVVESYVLNQFSDSVEVIAAQVGGLLEQIIRQNQEDEA